MVCKITVAFECKNLVSHNVAAMAKMLLVLKFVFLVLLNHPNIKFTVSLLQTNYSGMQHMFLIVVLYFD